ncbi:MAG: alpha-glucuronidase family glycosyl hydrolase [Pseudomonadota bacterium]
MPHRQTIFIAGLATLLMAATAEAASALVEYNASSAPIAFAAQDVESALLARNYKIERHDARHAVSTVGNHDLVVRFALVDRSDDAEFARLAPEGFVLRILKVESQRELVVAAVDAGGAMYGGLELAEQIRTRGVDGVVETRRNPYMPMRGTKFNIPLDLRTPSYTDMSDSAQANIATVWDFDFWRAYLDALARDRYNYVSLWNLHPFPSMVKVPEYPEVALADVWRSKIKFAEDYATNATGLVTPAMLASKEVVRRLTIEQKIAFWRRVMEYARDRNIDFYVMTWNVFTYGVDGKYGITDAVDNPKTIDYFRASVRAMFRTYPLLRGIGLTTGENMPEASFEAKEKWAFATYGQGVLDAARTEPTRQFRLIHRQHQSRAQDIAATFQPVIAQPNVDFVFSFKYAQAHVLSSTTQTFHHGYLESLGDLKTLWTLRNDDALMFRWAAPDFVREFVQNIPYERSQGYYYGSDMWVWGREFLDRRARTPRTLEVDKHWLHFLLWGRMGYDPSLGNDRIEALIAQRFPGIDASRFLAAWQDASMIYPLVTGFHWADFDFQWYIEACRSRPGPAKTASGFHSVETFITQPVHPGTDNIPIPQYVAAIARDGQVPKGTPPPEVAENIEARANAALASLAAFERSSLSRRNAEFAATLADIRAMALLGRYYAAKIRGATALAMYRQNKRPEEQGEAVRELTLAAEFWSDYTLRTGVRYRNPLWTNRVGNADWRQLTAEVGHDIEIARAPLR